MRNSSKKTPYNNLSDGPGLSQEECARQLGISRERVGQIERKALRKMREMINEQEEV